MICDNISFVCLRTCVVSVYTMQTYTQLSLSMCRRPPTSSNLWSRLPEWLVIIHCMRLNFTLFKIISSILQPFFSPHSGELQSKSCRRKNSHPAVWQQEVGVVAERINAFPTVTFLQNNCPIMTASSRVLCKRVSHFSWLCTVVSGGVKSGKIFFWGKHSAAGVQYYSSQSKRSLS